MTFDKRQCPLWVKFITVCHWPLVSVRNRQLTGNENIKSIIENGYSFNLNRKSTYCIGLIGELADYKSDNFK